MKTFLPQNQFNSASPVADDAAASSSPLPHDAAAALSDGGVESRHPEMARPCRPGKPEVAPGPSETEVAGSVRTAASDIDQLANYFRRHDSRFVPDKVAIWDAMFDETAPRAVLDPIWADEPPLFLQAIGS